MLKSPLYIVLRWLIVLGSMAFLVWRMLATDILVYQEHLLMLLCDFRFPLILVLSLFNWGLESEKWKKSLNGVIDLSRWDAFCATLAGTSVSFMTPNRTGEFLGRLYWLPKEKTGYAIPSSVYCSMNQLFVTLIAGSAILFFRKDILGDSYMRNLVFVLAFVLVFVLLVLLFQMSLLTGWIKVFLSKRGLMPYLNYLLEMKRQIKLQVFGLSVLRYMVFTFQFAVLLNGLGQVEWWYAISGVAILFFLQTLLPSFAFAEIGIRGTLALLVFSGVCEDEIIMFSTLLIWTFNLAIPALTGSILLAFKR